MDGGGGAASVGAVVSVRMVRSVMLTSSRSGCGLGVHGRGRRDARAGTSNVSFGRVVDLPLHVPGGFIMGVGSGAGDTAPYTMTNIGKTTRESAGGGVSGGVGPVGVTFVSQRVVAMVFVGVSS